MRWWEAIVGLGLFMSDDGNLVPHVKHLLPTENYGLRVSKALVWISEGWSFRSDSTDTPNRLKAQLKFIFRDIHTHTSVPMTTPTLTWTQKIIYHQSQSHNSRIISYAPPTTVNRSQPRNTRHRKEKGIKYSKISGLLLPPLVVDTSKSSIFIASTFDSWIAGFFFVIDSISLRRRENFFCCLRKWSLKSFPSRCEGEASLHRRAGAVRARTRWEPWMSIEKNEIHIGNS